MDASKIKRTQIVLPLVMCAIGLAINVLGKSLAAAWDSPFYFDTIGTILVSVLGGYVPGITVALFTNVLDFLADDESIYYSLLNILIALVTVHLFKKGWLNKRRMLLPYVVILAAIGGGMGGIITYLIYGVGLGDANAALAPVFLGMGMGEFASWYISVVLFDLLDKAISVFVVFLFLRVMTPKLKGAFRLRIWKQKPMEWLVEDSGKAESMKWPIKKKVFVILAVFFVAVTAFFSIVSVFLFRDYSVEENTKLAQGLAESVGLAVDAERVEEYLAQGEAAEGYAETEEVLESLLFHTPNVEYVYVYQMRPDGCYVVFDIDTETLAAENPGDMVPYDEYLNSCLPDLLAGKDIPPVITDDSYGWLLTAYAPVYDATGKCVCYAAVDMSMDGIREYERQFLVKMVFVFAGFLVLFVALVIWLASFHLIYPLNAIAKTADEFDYEDDKARHQNLIKLSDLDIRTGDEIEHLYRALLQTTEESTQFFEDNQTKMQQIERMQRSLVMTLANMVENRDGETGDHVRKTAAYVGIVARKMKELGYYTDQLTDKFIWDCVHSAPLHDIGKISIPDAILNKPGKLTEEEFEVMKTHAAEGERIIQQVTETMPDSDYLGEAENIAGGHHEKWNGTGYPNHLKGEEIPLSARIMAVADVFDALVSRRCYKEPFPYEKALSIIREDAGSHFDPLVADAFLQAQDEVIKVAEEFAAKERMVEKNRADA